MSQRHPLALVIALAAATALTASACGSSSTTAAVNSTSSSGLAAASSGCAPADLKTTAANTLTIATDNPAYDPWFSGNDPTNGKGFESAVAYAVATKLGYTKAQVKWTKQSFNAAISPAPKNFDFDINEFTITADRAKAVDFSTGYYDVTQAVVTVKSSKIAGAKSIADLKGAKLGAQIGTTSLDALNGVIAPSSKPTIFPTNDAAIAQLKNGQVDGIVVDTPTAFYMSSAQLDNGVIIGQLPAGTVKPDQFGLLLDKGSALTSCASKAVDALRADGTLAKLQTTWLANAGAPVLK
jgi:polar amino acid transport system substrate-binding protein